MLLTAAKLVNQFTDTAIELPAVLPSGGITSGNTTQAIGARPILKDMTNATTDTPDKIWLCMLRPMASRIENKAVKALELRSIRFVVKACHERMSGRSAS
jgi:hypothetical protein